MQKCTEHERTGVFGILLGGFRVAICFRLNSRGRVVQDVSKCPLLDAIRRLSLFVSLTSRFHYELGIRRHISLLKKAPMGKRLSKQELQMPRSVSPHMTPKLFISIASLWPPDTKQTTSTRNWTSGSLKIGSNP